MEISFWIPKTTNIPWKTLDYCSVMLEQTYQAIMDDIGNKHIFYENLFYQNHWGSFFKIFFQKWWSFQLLTRLRYNYNMLLFRKISSRTENIVNRTNYHWYLKLEDKSLCRKDSSWEVQLERRFKDLQSDGWKRIASLVE